MRDFFSANDSFSVFKTLKHEHNGKERHNEGYMIVRSESTHILKFLHFEELPHNDFHVILPAKGAPLFANGNCILISAPVLYRRFWPSAP